MSGNESMVRRIKQEIASKQLSGGGKECFTGTSLYVPIDDAFARDYPEQSKDAAMNLINMQRLAQWISADLIPAIKEVGTANNTQKAKSLKDPTLCMHARYMSGPPKSESKKTPKYMSSVWAAKNLGKIMTRIRPEPPSRGSAKRPIETMFHRKKQ